MDNNDIIQNATGKLKAIYYSKLPFDRLFDSGIMHNAITSNEVDTNKVEVDFGDYVITLIETDKRDDNSIRTKSNNVRIGKYVSLFLLDNDGEHETFSTTMRIVHDKDTLKLIR